MSISRDGWAQTAAKRGFLSCGDGGNKAERDFCKLLIKMTG